MAAGLTSAELLLRATHMVVHPFIALQQTPGTRSRSAVLKSPESEGARRAHGIGAVVATNRGVQERGGRLLEASRRLCRPRRAWRGRARDGHQGAPVRYGPRPPSRVRACVLATAVEVRAARALPADRRHLDRGSASNLKRRRPRLLARPRRKGTSRTEAGSRPSLTPCGQIWRKAQGGCSPSARRVPSSQGHHALSNAPLGHPTRTRP